MTLNDIISNRLDLDPETIRWLVRLLREEGTDLAKIGDRELSRGTPVYAEASADAVGVQRAMARNHVRTLFVIKSQDAIGTVGILDLAVHMDALSWDGSKPMPDEPGNQLNCVPISKSGRAVVVNDHGNGFTLRCSGRLGRVAAEELCRCLEHCLARQPAFVDIDARDIALLEEAGVDALLLAARRCRDAGVAYQLSINTQGKRVLHFAGPSDLSDAG